MTSISSSLTASIILRVLPIPTYSVYPTLYGKPYSLLQIDLILSIEEILQCLKISHWFPEVYDENKKRVVFINDPEKMIPKCCANAPEFIKRRYRKWHISDRFFKTGQQIAEAIKPQPVS